MNYPNLINLRVQSEGNILFLDSQNCEKLHKNLKGKKLKNILPRGTEERIDKKSGETHPAPAASLSWP
jgi:hypothetical protein